MVARALRPGEWVSTKRLGDAVNSGADEACPRLSPDGKYLFFLSNRTGAFRIYWVSASMIFEQQDIGAHQSAGVGELVARRGAGR